jgi:hypothetical protein
MYLEGIWHWLVVRYGGHADVHAIEPRSRSHMSVTGMHDDQNRCHFRSVRVSLCMYSLRVYLSWSFGRWVRY